MALLKYRTEAFMHAPIFVCLAAAAGCASQRPLSELHQVAGKQVEVSVNGHPSENAIAIQQGDGLVLRTRDGDVPLASATQIVDIKRGRGAAQGLLVGLLVGVGAGIAIGFAAGDDEPCPDDGHLCLFNFTAGDKAAIWGILLGALGLGTGAVIGYTHGARDVYDLSTPQPRFVPTGPPGSAIGGTVRF
jgi:hypothetical protein